MAGSDTKLDGRRIAILATDGVEQVELTSPQQALKAAGAKVTVVSLRSGKIQGMNHSEKGEKSTSMQPSTA